MNECIDSLVKATVFSTLDANSGFWRIKIEDADREKTAFTLHHSLYYFIQMPFGLQNAAGTSQRTMAVLQSSVTWQLTAVVLEDIAIFSKTSEKHGNHIRKALLVL